MEPEEEPYFTIPILHYFSQLFEMPGNPPVLLCELLNSCLLHPPTVDIPQFWGCLVIPSNAVNQGFFHVPSN